VIEVAPDGSMVEDEGEEDEVGDTPPLGEGDEGEVTS
jgi:hypothetical protein